MHACTTARCGVLMPLLWLFVVTTVVVVDDNDDDVDVVRAYAPRWLTYVIS